jgi:hypothetical protein
MDDTLIRTATPVGAFRRHNDPEKGWQDMSCVRVYPCSPGSLQLQLRGTVRQEPAGRNAWPAYMGTYLNAVQARELRDALDRWLSETITVGTTHGAVEAEVTRA